MRIVLLGIVLSASLASWRAEAQRTGVPLNDYVRLGQRFTVERPLDRLRVTVPSWLDNEGGLTLTLWDSPARRRQLARQSYANIPDNANVELRLPRPLKPGTYYWEVSERTGTTRVGLYADPIPNETDDCAYFDGKPDRRRVFVYVAGYAETNIGARTSAELVTVLRSNASVAEKSQACRELAVVGDRKSVDVLASLLADPALAHMARHALEPMPFAEVDTVFREALEHLEGALLVGVINSIGVRRDARSVPLLARRLTSEDPQVRSATAAALGRIGTRAAADVLATAMATARSEARAELAEASLECARLLIVRKERVRAGSLYRAVYEADVPEHIRAAALQGIFLADATPDLPLLARSLREGSPRVLRAVLWTAAQELKGRSEVTRLLASELSRLPEDRAALLAEALGHRGDLAALESFRTAAETGSPALRHAATRALARLRHPSAVAVLVSLVRSGAPETAAAASEALSDLALMDAEAAAVSLMNSGDMGARLIGMEIVARRGIIRLKPRLLEMARSGEATARVAALKALQGLVDGRDLPGLIALLPTCDSREDLAALEASLTAAVTRSKDAEETADMLARAFAGATGDRRGTLLRALAVAGGPKALEVVRETIAAPDETLHALALDLLCEWTTLDAVPDLIRLAREDANTSVRLRSLRGALRIAGSADIPADQRLRICRDVLPLVTRHDEERILLGSLSSITLPEALEMASAFLDTPEVLSEASEAILTIAEKLPAKQRGSARIKAILARVQALATDASLRDRASALLAGG